jgi:putative PIN family toxin of toxin-antitoxin system
MANNLFVFDTNILVSALFDDKSIPALALKKARAKGILLISDEIAAEYISVFSREKFDKYVPQSLRFSFLENIISNALPVIIESPVKACRDPKDDILLSLAVNADASFIVTGDNDLLVLHPFQGIPIITPLDFLNIPF